MNKLLTSWLINLIIILSATGYAIASETTITVQHSNKQPISITFEHAPRVDSAILTATNHHHLSLMDIDWLQSKLFDNTAPFSLKGETLSSIREQEARAKGKDKPYWQALSTQFQEWHFSARVMTPLDPDTTRLDVNKNPRLRGQYQLYLRDISAEPTINVLGYVKQPRTLPWYPRKSAVDYLEITKPISSSHSSVWVIQPDGQAFEYPIAYWNYQFHNIAPGAIIYVPMPLNLVGNKSTTNKDTNQLVIELLTHKLPL
ncbi:capsule biosynthesis GfcC family protein [Vibrio sp. ZSDE26]|uniref:Capsule biosynthesis GfcC family protein n=1 Tax=Vibrio amylolyticus TaxID=2847292 RepID=A0A9X1XJE3_9VIBR|nr:capsule biosynthesis GfcC family protein [Vibrio amylolyticus]MCK6263190.1 capsule biosynthesis GfcC family protein [Vibrio amylolyticus]